jgi:predicted ABC-type sugar transport system permease subunit
MGHLPNFSSGLKQKPSYQRLSQDIPKEPAMNGLFPFIVIFILNCLLMGFGGFMYLGRGLSNRQKSGRNILMVTVAMGLVGSSFLVGTMGFAASALAAAVVIGVLSKTFTK